MKATTDADLVVLGTGPHSKLYTLLFGDVATRISNRIDGNVLLFYPNERGTQTFLRKVLDRTAFGTADSSSSSPSDNNGGFKTQ